MVNVDWCVVPSAVLVAVELVNAIVKSGSIRSAMADAAQKKVKAERIASLLFMFYRCFFC